MQLKSGNQKNQAMNGSGCRDDSLPGRYRAGSGNGYGTQQVNPFCMDGVPIGEHALGSADTWSVNVEGTGKKGDT
jgi:hypothetical protein